MRRVFSFLGLATVASVCGWAGPITVTTLLGTFAVNPQQTFLFQSSNDVNLGALFINLNGCTGGNTLCVNAPAGSTLQIVGLGQQCFLGDPSTCTEFPEELGGAFDTNNVLLSSNSLTGGNVDRLTGAVNAGVSNVSNHNFNTWWNCSSGTCVGGASTGVDTTIPNDFLIPTGNGITFVVPTGAQFLAVGVFDSFFTDNSDRSNTLAVQLNQISQVVTPVPEPATFGLMAAGLIGFGLLRRRSGSN